MEGRTIVAAGSELCQCLRTVARGNELQPKRRLRSLGVRKAYASGRQRVEARSVARCNLVR